MITCPSCRHNELEGELLCSRCGARLWTVSEQTLRLPTSAPGPETQGSKPPTGPKLNTSAQTAPVPPPLEVITGPAGATRSSDLRLRLIDSEVALTLAGRVEYMVGRDGGDIHPDADFGPHGGQERGMSRRHAALRIDRGRVYLTDLGSSNGTQLNGEALPAHLPTRVMNGDLVRFGKLMTRIEFDF
jgi:hypothetical protein